MSRDYQAFVDNFIAPACVLSVEKAGNGPHRTIRIVAGNRAYLDTIEKPVPGLNDHPKKFIPDLIYTNYIQEDVNFEQASYQAAVCHKKVSSYVHPDKFDFWFDMLFIPMPSDDEDLGYCVYSMDLSLKPEAGNMSSTSADIAQSVLDTCIKLRSIDDFQEAMDSICKDIRALCDSEHCCILMMDTAKRSCSVLCEAFSETTKLLPMGTYLDDSFYDIAESWEGTLAGSNCLIIKNEKEMEIVRERNPVWCESITQAGGKSIVLFPLKFKNELMGYIWAINFSAEKADKIKETLELTTFILASEIYSNRTMERLHILSSRDMLTGVMNRNEMNNYVISLVNSEETSSVGVLFADLNGLKTINDSEGHIAGDTLLKNAASALREVFDKKNIFRAGGDEFVVILTGLTEDDLYSKVETLRKVSEKYDRLVFAVGAAYEPNSADVRIALHNADERMYADKKLFYEKHPEMRREAVKRTD